MHLRLIPKLLDDSKSHTIQFYFSQSRVMSKILSCIILFLIFVIREKMAKNSSRRGYLILLSRNWRGFCGGTFAFYYISGKRFPIKFFWSQKFSSSLQVIKKRNEYENLPHLPAPPQEKKTISEKCFHYHYLLIVIVIGDNLFLKDLSTNIKIIFPTNSK